MLRSMSVHELSRLRRRRALVLVASLGSPVLAGCMFFRSLDDLQSGAADAGVDVASPDASSISDGGADMGADIDAADGASPCSVPHTFCDDFEREGDAAAGWEHVDVSAGSSLLLGVTQGAVTSRALFVSVPLRPSVDHATLSASLTKHLDRPIKKVHVELDLFVEKPAFKPSDVGLARLVLFMGGADGFAGTVLFNDESSAAMSVEQLSGGDRYFAVPAFPYDERGHVSLDFDLAGSLHFELPGGGGTRTFPAVTLGASPHLDLTVGLTSFDGPIPEHRAYVDNVVLDVE